MTAPLEGIIPALLTPFCRDGERIDFDLLHRLIAFHLGAGAGGFYVCGSSGEWFRLSTPERRCILEEVVRHVEGAVPVVAHIGHFTTADAVILAEHAAQAGAAMISSLTPASLPLHVTDREVRAYYSALAGVGLPLMTYYLESSGMRVDPADCIQMMTAIPYIVGMKYTSPDALRLQELLRRSEGNLRVWSGHDPGACWPWRWAARD